MAGIRGHLIVLGVSGFVVFFLSRDVNRKRRLFPGFTVLTGILFVGFVWAMGFSGGIVLAAIPIVALISWLNIRQTRFCDACGRTVVTMFPGQRPRYCHQCGAALDQH